jgi:subtilisin family serine protease
MQPMHDRRVRAAILRFVRGLCRGRTGVLLAAGLGLALSGARAATPPSVLDGELQSVLSRAPSDAAVPFVAVLRVRANPITLRAETDRLRLEGRRAEARTRAIAALKGVADRTQGPVFGLLRAAQRNGRATRVTPLWVANAIAGEATPEVIRALALLPAVERVIWDPVTPVDLQSDEIVPTHGLRSLAAGPAGGRDPSIGWNLVRIGAPQAWSQGHTGQGIVVAIIDTGVDYTHPDLADHIWRNADEIPRNGIDDDFNGFVDDTLGWDFVFGTNNPMGEGPTDHGTRSAGLVAGDGTGGVATGVAPDAVIMPIKASGGAWSNLYSGIQYAIDNGADVISMSVSQKWHFNPRPDYSLWRQITDNVLAAGVFHANSIGNEGDNLETDPVPFNVAAPGCNPAPWIATEQYVVGGISSVTGVGAIDSLGYLDDFSSRGPSAWEDIAARWPEYPYAVPDEYRDYPYSNGERGLIKPDILAPGDEVLSTKQGGGYLSFSGTSAACPHVAGAMAILLAAHPELTPSQMAMVLQRSASDLGPRGKDNAYGAGLLRIPGALTLAADLSTYCRVAGAVRDTVSGDSLPGALVDWLEGWRSDSTNVSGRFELMAQAGVATLVTRCFGYRPDTLQLALAPGDTLDLSIGLGRWPTGELTGLVRDSESGLPIEGAVVSVPNTPARPETTGPDGAYAFHAFLADTTLPLRVVRFGYGRVDTQVRVPADSSAQQDFTLARAIADDFEVDQGWTVGAPDDNATCGLWVRADPVGIIYNGVTVEPEYDHTAGQARTCFVTGNGVPGCGPHQNDVDGGVTTLISPRFDAVGYFEPTLSLWYFYSNDAGIFDDDTLRIELSNDDGASWVAVLVRATSNHAWQELVVPVDDYLVLTDRMRLRVRAADRGQDSSVKVAIDDFWMGTPGWADAAEPVARPSFAFHAPQPNPSATTSTFRFTLARPAAVRLEIFDVSGRRIRVIDRAGATAGGQTVSWDGADDTGRTSPAGTYFARLSTAGRQATQRVVRIR